MSAARQRRACSLLRPLGVLLRPSSAPLSLPAQFVMGGFLDLKVSAGMRTLITRGVAIFPTMLVALGAGGDSTKVRAWAASASAS